MLSIAILLFVFLLIAVRKIGNIRLQIWQIMLIGAFGVLMTGQISPARAAKAINPDVMLFLFSMFIIGQALEESGYLARLAYRIFGRAKSLDGLIILVLLGMGGLAALLMNDTIAIIGTPIMLLLARKTGARAKVLLLALAFAVTIGSVLSPIGNPQNLLIAINGGVAKPFVTFVRFLLVPTVVNLGIAYGFLRLFYRKDFRHEPSAHIEEPLTDPKLARLAEISLILLVVLIFVKITIVLVNPKFDFRLTYIGLTAAAPIILFSRKRFSIVRRIDWFTLIFFAAMFILMESVWDAGVFQSVINGLHIPLTSTGSILTVSVLLSQLISNVPLVALYLPMLKQLGAATPAMMALAAGSTIAGNFSILGAASNVIIIQNAEKKSSETLTFWEFARIGVPLTMLNVVIYWLFFRLVL